MSLHHLTFCLVPPPSTPFCVLSSSSITTFEYGSPTCRATSSDSNRKQEKKTCEQCRSRGPAQKSSCQARPSYPQPPPASCISCLATNGACVAAHEKSPINSSAHAVNYTSRPTHVHGRQWHGASRLSFSFSAVALSVECCVPSSRTSCPPTHTHTHKRTLLPCRQALRRPFPFLALSAIRAALALR